MRDELFLMAANGEISFDHPAYWMQRSAMNGMIRFAHRYSLSHFVILTACVGNAGHSLTEDHIARWNTSVDSLNVAFKNKILAMRMRMHALLLLTLLNRHRY